MTFRYFIPAIAIAIGLTACASLPLLHTTKDQTMTSKTIVVEAVTALFTEFDATKAGALIDPDYIQHNPQVPTGAPAVLGFLPALKESGITTTTHRMIAEGDLVVLHVTYDNAQLFGGEHMVTFDVFRVEDGKLAEHWDNLVAVTPPNPSGHTQTDGVTTIVDLEKTATNKLLVENFIEVVLKNGEGDRITEFISTDLYIQHNSDIADGLDGLGAAIAAWADQGITMKYDTVHLVVGEGNFVFTASEGILGGKRSAFFDMFRIEDGKIVEHWDTITEIPSEMAHENGKF